MKDIKINTLHINVFHKKTISCIIIMTFSNDELIETIEEIIFFASLKTFFKKGLEKGYKR